MLTLENLLSTADRSEFHALVEQATKAGAQAVRWHSQANGLLVVGLCSGGELLTWFATPAHSESEADIAQAVILSGIAQASLTVAALQSGASDIAAGMH